MPILLLNHSSVNAQILKETEKGLLKCRNSEEKIVYLFSAFVFPFPSLHPHLPNFKIFLTLDIFFITYLLHEIDCSLLNLVQLYPDSERCTVGADEYCTALSPWTLLYQQQTRNGTSDVISSHVIFFFFYPSV